MRDDDEYEDDDEEPEAEERPRLPGVVKAAGWIWIGIGCLHLFSAVLTVVMMYTKGGGRIGGSLAGGLCPSVLGFAFLWCGRQSLSGKAQDTLGNAIGSLVLGSLQLGLAMIALVVASTGQVVRNRQLNLTTDLVLIISFMSFFGTLLIVAGVFALIGRRAYSEWREVAHPKKRRRRPSRRRDADDEDDA